MNRSSTTLASVLALAVVTACGGGGAGGITNLEPVAAAASPPPTAERVVTIVSRDGSASKLFPAAIPTPANSIPRVDPLVAQRVQAELDKIEWALRNVDSGKVEKHEALEVVSDARAELQRDRPNRLKLRSLLTGLAQGVQMLDGAMGAGDILGRLVPMV